MTWTAAPNLEPQTLTWKRERDLAGFAKNCGFYIFELIKTGLNNVEFSLGDLVTVHLLGTLEAKNVDQT